MSQGQGKLTFSPYSLSRWVCVKSFFSFVHAVDVLSRTGMAFSKTLLDLEDTKNPGLGLEKLWSQACPWPRRSLALALVLSWTLWPN